MGLNIGIDTGGTFTDGFFFREREQVSVKVETTPHDLTECFIHCLQQGAEALGLSLQEMLLEVDIIRYCTTIATNCLIQRTGPRIGLIVSQGSEESLYTDQPATLEPFVSRAMIAGVVQPLVEEAVKRTIKDLLEKGARLLAISLRGALQDPSDEVRIREIANQEYPPHYLGYVPILVSNEITARAGDFARTATTVMSAYVHRDLVKYLYKLEDELHREGFTRPLLVVHSDGSVCRVARSKAISTLDSGPAAGVQGAAFFGGIYGIPDLVSVDVGGTSTDIALVRDGRYQTQGEITIEGYPILSRHINLKTFGGGGGSIARVEDGRCRVGPESAGALPGPVCYDLGGFQPTVTDACLALGDLNPDYFLGGRRTLNAAAARSALEEEIARPLHLSLEEAAWKVKTTLERNIAAEVKKELDQAQLDPTRVTLFSFGGAGGMVCCGYADRLGIRRIIGFSQAAVFSAIGATTLDLSHLYEHPQPVMIRDPQGNLLSNLDLLNQGIRRLHQRALRDMRGEGIPPETIKISLELEMRDGRQTFSTTLSSPQILFEDGQDLDRIAQEFIRRYRQAKGGEGKFSDAIQIELFRLTALSLTPKYAPPAHEPGGEDPQAGLKGSREIFWGHGLEATPVYGLEQLQGGNLVLGPAIIEAIDTTYLIPAGWRCQVDRYRNCVLEKTD
ncbi:MAG: hydantoinase/oxoprolinase family protein [Candidatus Tectomicrobia bacterium]|uniref:Hydantoinase/oxoprolinase family protein n=1 Tax=Tectimicrobiota bacterium TaxID=2528274 RepID=A0A932FUC1_UNCTE|nr:hydantoinase/oxoprolinase family protein [Candidatus Tectomicrobia bacterium]